jgi:hypothetical protein
VDFFISVSKDIRNPPQVEISQPRFPALFSVKVRFFHNRLGYILAAFTDHKSRHPYDTGCPAFPVVFPDCLFS